MSKYGFKLLEIQLRRNTGRKAIDFGNADGKPYLDRLHADALGAIADRKAEEARAEEERLSPTLEEGEIEVTNDDLVHDEDDDAGLLESNGPAAVVRIDGVSRLVSAVLLTISYGVVGDHSKGIDPEGRRADVDLSSIATARPYRALIVAPTQGNTAYLGVEVISRAHAATRLPARLLKSARGHNFKIKSFGAVADEESIRLLMTGAHVSEVKLMRRVPSADASTPSTNRATLTFSIGKGSPEEVAILKRLARWVPTKKNKAAKKKPVAATEAEQLASYLWPAAKELDFVGVEAVVKKENKTRRLKPLDMREGFTYDLGDEELDDDAFVAELSDVINRLALSNSVDLDDDWESPVADPKS